MKMARSRGGVGRKGRFAGQVELHQLANAREKSPTQIQECERAANEHKRRAQVRAERDLPLLPGLLPAMRRWIMRLVAKLIGHGSKVTGHKSLVISHWLEHRRVFPMTNDQ